MNYLVLGIFAGALYSIIAIGFVFVYNVISAYPFQHGAFAVLLAYTFIYLHGIVSNVFVAALLTVVAGAVGNVLIGRVAFAPLLGRHFPSLIVGFGLLVVIQESISLYFYGGQSVSFPVQLAGGLSVGGTVYTYSSLLAFAVAVLVTLSLDLFFARTRQGMEMRAIANSPVAARLSGISVPRRLDTAFIVAGASAAIAGIVVGLLQGGVSPQLGGDLTIKAFAAALVGGSTSVRGCIVAAMGIGVAESLAVGYVSSSFSEVVAYAAIILTLLVRPNGLFGHAEEARA